VTIKSKSGLYLSFHEANLTDYADMTLEALKPNNSMKSILVGSERTSFKVKRSLPFATPRRTIQLAKNAVYIIESNLIVNLNEPNKLDDISWFKPMKYMGIWWETHVNISSWDMASGKHGATTENAKKYIDFAFKNNIKGLLVEGWNTGWEHWIRFEDRERVFEIVTPYPDYNLKEVVEYADKKDIEIIMHHETDGQSL
jgi:alpha-glucosidase